MRKRKSAKGVHPLFPVTLFIVILCRINGGCSMQKYELPISEPAIFSWRTDNLEDIGFLENLGVLTFFQEVPKGQDDAVLEALKDYCVYLLDGHPAMELEEMKQALLRAGRSYQGLVLDVEPYGLAEWSLEEDRSIIIDRYCEKAEALYAYARELDVELIFCIPFWYDELGFKEQLERIVRSSDGICVMNYSRGHERAKIAEEYRLAGKYGKKLWTIYELSQCDGKGIMEENTYHDQGLNAVLKNYKKVFSDTGIGLAFHDLTAVRQAAIQWRR